MARGWIKNGGARAELILQTLATKPDQLWTAYSVSVRVGIDPKTADKILTDVLLKAGRVEREWGPQGALWRISKRP